MTQKQSPFEALQAHVADRPRVTEEVFSALQAMAKDSEIAGNRELGKLLLEYLLRIHEWMSEEERLVRALPRHSDQAAVENALQTALSAPGLNVLEKFCKEEEAWRRQVLKQLNALRGQG